MKLLSIIILVFFSAFFSSAETSITSINSFKIRKYIEEGNKNAIILGKLVDDSAETISAILVGNNIVNIIAPSISALFFVSKFGSKGIAYSTIFMTVILLIFGEVVPKTLANKYAVKYSLAIAPVVRFFVILFTPFTKIFTVITSWFIKDEEDDKITEDDLMTILNVSHEEGILENEEKDMIENVFDLTESKASDVMTPRTSIVAIDSEIPFDELLETVKQTHFSRLPVYGETIDDILGILYVKDLVGLKEENYNLRTMLRPAYFQFESKSSYKLLGDLKKNKSTIAVLVDEYGGTSGIVTVEDIVEEIVGDIDDEFDEVTSPIRKIKDNIYLIAADTDIDDVNEILNTNFQSDDYESIGGFVIGLAGKFPKVGERYKYKNYEFYIERANQYQLIKIRLWIR